MSRDVTHLLLEWNEDNKAALDELIPIVADELRQMAAKHLRDEKLDHTLQPTALVNEVYLKLVDRKQVTWEKRAHFFGFAATTMRRLLVDHARAKQSGKRGGGAVTVLLDENLQAKRDLDVLALEEGMKELEELSPRQSRIVELRFYAGLSVQEAALVLDVGTATITRDWIAARAWLYRYLKKAAPA